MNYLTKIEFDLLLSNIDEAIRQLEQEIREDCLKQGIDPEAVLSGEKVKLESIISPYDPGGVGQRETHYSDGSTHFTTFNTETGMHHSHDADAEGNVFREHPTNHNLPKGHKNRH